uniref:Phosphatidylinositol transfer protein n=1 Tax=Parascaris univalens TaxID=6257 RepID=A0A914ZVH9_PARUN
IVQRFLNHRLQYSCSISPVRLIDGMIVKEYRILLPLAVAEYQRAQLYAVAETSKNETGGGDGVLVLKQHRFTSDKIRPDGQMLSGMYTSKIYHSKSKSPWVFRKLLPDAAFILHEECWNAYPYCKTIITNPEYMKENFYLTIESMHLADRGGSQNALALNSDLLKKREIVMIDIYNDSDLKATDITPETDPRVFLSKRTGRGKLTADWSKNTTPVMCCYKVVQIQFKIFGWQRIVERMFQLQYPRIFCKFNRETFCWIDKWYDMSMDEIRKLEHETAIMLTRRIKDPEYRGIICDVGDRPADATKSDISIG